MTKRKPKSAVDFAQIWSEVNSVAPQRKPVAKPKVKRPIATKTPKTAAKPLAAPVKRVAVKQPVVPVKPRQKSPPKKRAYIFLDEVVVRPHKPRRGDLFEPVLLVRRGQEVVVAEESYLPMPPSIPDVYNRTELARSALSDYFSRATPRMPTQPTTPSRRTTEPDELPVPRADFQQHLQQKPLSETPPSVWTSFGHSLRWRLARLLLRNMI